MALIKNWETAKRWWDSARYPTRGRPTYSHNGTRVVQRNFLDPITCKPTDVFTISFYGTPLLNYYENDDVDLFPQWRSWAVRMRLRAYYPRGYVTSTGGGTWWVTPCKDAPTYRFDNPMRVFKHKTRRPIILAADGEGGFSRSYRAVTEREHYDAIARMNEVVRVRNVKLRQVRTKLRRALKEAHKHGLDQSAGPYYVELLNETVYSAALAKIMETAERFCTPNHVEKLKDVVVRTAADRALHEEEQTSLAEVGKSPRAITLR